MIIILKIKKIMKEQKNKNYNNKRKTIKIMMIIALKKTTIPQLNNILQLIERCELAIGIGQRATDFRIVVQQPTHK